MKPIPKHLMIHSADLKTVTADKWQAETLTLLASLKKVRIEPISKLITDKQNRQITISAMLFYDCVVSMPQNVIFAEGQKIIFNGKKYTIETIEPLYDEKKLHHYELGLS